MILTLAVTGGGAADRDRFTSMVADALKISETEAKARVADMVAGQEPNITGQGSAVTVTGAAQQLHSRIRAAIAGSPTSWGSTCRRAPGHRRPCPDHYH